MNNKETIILWIGLAIPVLMLIVIGLSIAIPRFLSQPPKVDYLYFTNTYDYGSFQVISGKLNYTKSTYSNSGRQPVIYYHDVTENLSREISLTEAEGLKLDSNLTSPDGYKFTGPDYNNGIFPLFSYSSHDFNARYLRGNNTRHSQNLKSSTGYYAPEFIGWVIN